MKVSVNVKAGAKKELVSVIDAKHFAVHVKEVPEKGKANASVIKALAKHLGISKSRIIILRGHTSSNKMIEIT